jgi:nucleotide-binding universal stress UspA family protein
MTDRHRATAVGIAAHSAPGARLYPKTVTVFLDSSPSGKHRAALAAALARRWDAYLIAVHVVFAGVKLHPSESFAVGETAIQQVIAHQQSLCADAEAAAARLRQYFQAVCARSNVDGEWRRIDGSHPAQAAIFNSLHSDLVIVGHPEPHGLPDGMRLETILLASGTPLLVLPNAWHSRTIGNKVLISWNASREARRAISDAMAFLVDASSVTTLLVDASSGGRHGERPGADVTMQLVRHGVHINVQRKESNGISVAQVILGHAVQSGSDLLVFGAYSHARVRELLLGGTTRTLLAQMPVPVLVSR